MDHDISRAGWDIYLFGIPLIVFLVFTFFRLDQVFTSRKDTKHVTRRPPPFIDKKGASMRSDPDGRSWDDQSPSSKK